MERRRRKALPKKIYKYMPIDNYTLKNLLNNQLWFNSPKNFNDPFDCRLPINWSHKESDLEFYDKIFGLKDEELKQKLKEFNDDPQKFYDEIIYPRFFVSCFSRSKVSVLMWSHYANRHKGICLEFHIDSDMDFFNKEMLARVLYKYTSPNIKPIKRGLDEFGKLLFIKSDVWDYEEEVRLVSLEQGAKEFKKEALTKVIFGSECSADDLSDITKLVKLCDYPDVTFHKATKEGDIFEVKIIDIDTV